MLEWRQWTLICSPLDNVYEARLPDRLLPVGEPEPVIVEIVKREFFFLFGR